MLFAVLLLIIGAVFASAAERDKGVAETRYTENLYLALGLGALVLFIVIYFIYRLVMGPSVRWKKPKPVKI